MEISVPTSGKRQIIDITDQVAKNVQFENGIVNIFVKHTTAAITTADLDPGTDKDFLDFLQSLIPEINWRHPHDPSHAPDHLISSIIGPGIMVQVSSGKLELGTWQRIILVELDGPRKRKVALGFIKQSP
jgi:secondary thiamine-phosphate synthase enzyme